MTKEYESIIKLPHPTSARHPRMSVADRAAQFAPFAAVRGYDMAIQETSRITEQKPELSDDEKAIINRKLKIIEEHTGTNAIYRFVYFVPDKLKSGGAYVPYDGMVKKIDTSRRCLLLTDHTIIDIDQIVDIQGELFDQYAW